MDNFENMLDRIKAGETRAFIILVKWKNEEEDIEASICANTSDYIELRERICS
jgi:hypothetical protein